jgi:hypothetical protein
MERMQSAALKAAEEAAEEAVVLKRRLKLLSLLP